MSIETRLDIIIALLVALILMNTTSVISNILSVIQVTFKLEPGVRRLWGWVMKRKHMRDKAWPIRTLIRAIRVIDTPNADRTLTLAVDYVLEARDVPVTVEGITVHVDAPHRVMPYIEEESPFGVSIIDDYVGAKGVEFIAKTLSRRYTAVFELPFSFQGHGKLGVRLEVSAKGLPCFTEVENVML